MMQALSLGEADDAVARLDTQSHSIAEALLYLDDHPVAALLEASPLTGVTAERWHAARKRTNDLWIHFDVFRVRVSRVREVRHRRSRPSAADLVEITELLATPLPTSSGPTIQGQRPLDDLYDDMRDAVAFAIETLSAVDAVWTELAPEVRRVHGRLRTLEELAGELELDRITDPIADQLAGCAAELEDLGGRVKADPLSLHVAGTVEPRELRRLAGQVELVSAQLASLDRLRTQAGTRLAGLRSLLAECRSLTAEADMVQREVVRTIAGVTVAEAASTSTNFSGRLAMAEDLRRRARWGRLSALLDEMERDARRELRRMRDVVADYRRPLEQWAELSGRVGAYRAKALAVGLAEDPRQDEQYRLARRLLASTPCDLNTAEAAVAAYQWAINAGVNTTLEETA